MYFSAISAFSAVNNSDQINAQSPLQLSVLISGSGTTLQNLIDRIADASLNANIAMVVASRPGINGIERAASAKLACQVVERAKFPSVADFSQQVFKICTDAKADLVCLAGWLSLLEIPPRFMAGS